jgi:hypothetical protein
VRKSYTMMTQTGRHPFNLDTETLPVWMQRALRGTDWGMVLVILFGLLSASPFVLQSGVPLGMNFERYTFRTADMAQSIREGTLYPRWTDEALGGYGAPLPHFTPPLPGLLGGLLDLLVVANAPASTAVVFIAAIVGSGMAVYAWIARRMGAAAGLTAALFYLFNPVISHTIPHYWGDLALMLYAALLPSLLWSVDRLLHDSRPADIATSALLVAALLLTNPAHAIGGALLCLPLCVVGQHLTKAAILRLGWALLIGAALAACFWLPAWTEASAVIWLVPEINPPLAIDPFHLFTLPAPADPLALMPLPAPTVGVVGLIASLAGWALYRRFQPADRHFFAAAWLLLLAVIVLIALTPDALWLLVPLSLSINASGVVPLSMRRMLTPSLSRVLTLALCAITIGSTVSLWLSELPNLNDSNLDFSSSGQVAYEQRGYGVAVASIGQHIPSALPAETPPDPALIRSYLAGRPARLTGVRGSIQIGTLNHSAHTPRFQVSAFSPGTARLLTGSFPGWSAALAQRPIPLIADVGSPFLLISFEEGERGELAIALSPTPARAAGWALTWIGVGAIGVLFMRQARRGETSIADFPLLTHAESRLFSVLLMGVCLLMLLARTQPHIARLLGWIPEQGSGLIQAQPRTFTTDSGLQLIGVAGTQADRAADERFQITLFWRALRRIDTTYRVQMALRDLQSGRIVFTLPVRHPGHLPMSRWLVRRYVRDPWHITLPTGIAPGNYELVVSTFACLATCETRQSLTFFDESGAAMGTIIPIGQTIHVSPR